ncbi:hypothetical protein KKG58_02600 [Patescibacteria group bacterium]|nr:hypothetical protein [Patescibacteria group bacterium]
MSKKDTTIINVNKTIAPIISSRDIIGNLGNSVEKKFTNDIALDFNNVQFISRSAAHQLLIVKEKFANRLSKKKTISFINTNDEVAKMLRLVAASRALPQKKAKFDAEIINIQSLIARS